MSCFATRRCESRKQVCEICRLGLRGASHCYSRGQSEESDFVPPAAINSRVNVEQGCTDLL